MAESSSRAAQIERSTLVAAPIGTVWSALTTPEGLAKWYAFGGARIDLRVGGAIVLHWEEHGTFFGKIEAVDAPRRFAYRLAVVGGVEPTPRNSTIVSFQLDEEAAGTLLAVRESGYDLIDPAYGLPEDLPALAGQGWDGGFALLRQLLEPTD